MRALELGPNDRVLSIASAGEMPLSLLSVGVASLVAVDVDPAQLLLTQLKFVAACTLGREETIRFLGYGRRRRPSEAAGWMPCCPTCLATRGSSGGAPLPGGTGRDLAGRFEQYLQKITRVAVPLLGRRRIEGIFDCATIADQEAYFDTRLDLSALKALLRVVFNRKVYAQRGMDPRSLQYRTATDEPLGVQFFRQFRNALTRTPARENHLMQLILLGRTMSEGCIPAYLSPAASRHSGPTRTGSTSASSI